jgi:hypothetical protein
MAAGVKVMVDLANDIDEAVGSRRIIIIVVITIIMIIIIIIIIIVIIIIIISPAPCRAGL